MALVLVYQKGLNGEGGKIPFSAELLKTKHQRLFLRWEMPGGYFVEQWVNAGCCSTVTGRTRTKPKIPLQRVKP